MALDSIQSDRYYKALFRELYSAYATADDAFLKHLKNRLDRSIFEPASAFRHPTPIHATVC